MNWIEGKGTATKISEDRLMSLIPKITPLIMKNGQLRKFDPVHPRKQSMLWEPSFYGAPIPEAKFEHIRVFHVDFPCAYYGLFKPSVAEVLAWLPEDEPDINAFYLDDNVDIYKDGEFHRCLVYFGKIDAKYRKGPSKNRKPPKQEPSLKRTDEQMVAFLKDVEYMVEATSNERFMLWEKWHYSKEGRQISWESNNVGLMETVGYIDKRPVVMTLNTAVIGGKKILFYDGTSQLVDHALIDKWLVDNLPDVCKTDAGNFHCAVN